MAIAATNDSIEVPLSYASGAFAWKFAELVGRDEGMPTLPLYVRSDRGSHDYGSVGGNRHSRQGVTPRIMSLPAKSLST